MFNSFTDEQEEQGEEGERREEAAGAPRGVHDQERGRPPRGRLPVAQVWPEGRQKQLVPEELLPLHGGAVRGEEAGGALAPGPLHGDHHVRGAAHAPEPRERPHQVRRRRRGLRGAAAAWLPPGPARDGRRLRSRRAHDAEQLSNSSRRSAPADEPYSRAPPFFFASGCVRRRAGLHSVGDEQRACMSIADFPRPAYIFVISVECL